MTTRPLRHWLGPLLLLCAGLPAALAQGSAAPDEERARIAAERAKADAQFAQDEKACYARFAVNDCQNEARARRRETLADLRRQEVSLNDAQRKRKGADRIRSIEERAGQQKQEREAQDRAKAADSAKSREERAAQKASDRAAGEASHQARPAKTDEGERSHKKVDTADALKKNNERLQEAKARRERVEKKQKERQKPPATALPVPLEPSS